MADTKRRKGRRLGPFRLGREYRDDAALDFTRLGPFYEARNVRTGAPSWVLLPGPHVRWKPTGNWTVRATCNASPFYVALEVERSPTRSSLKDLGQLMDLLTSVSLRAKYIGRMRRHLTSGARRQKRREEGLTLLACGFAAGLAVLGLFLGVRFWRASPEAPASPKPATAGVALQAVAESQATSLAAKFEEGASSIAYPMPDKPFSNQSKAPCEEDEVQINGGCWVELAKRPPCAKQHAEYRGKCYLPVSAGPKIPREPRSIQP